MAIPVGPLTGVWYDYKNNEWTLTLREREAGVLTAILVIFTGFVASQAWNITKFLLHQIRASDQGWSDGLDHQQMAAIRNSNSHLHAAWLAISLAAAWRHVLGISRTIWRLLPLFLVALLSLALWSAAQLTLSYIWTTATDQFRIDKVLCGTLYPEGAGIDDEGEAAQVWNVYYMNRLEEASVYEGLCYSSSNPDPSACGRLPVPRLSFTAEDAPCPVANPDLCIYTNSTPIIMDSGYINSHTHLGVNAAPENAIEYRKLASCSPMQSNHAKVLNRDDPLSKVYRYYYWKLDRLQRRRSRGDV